VQTPVASVKTNPPAQLVQEVVVAQVPQFKEAVQAVQEEAVFPSAEKAAVAQATGADALQ
jgi:hypothetical protein